MTDVYLVIHHADTPRAEIDGSHVREHVVEKELTACFGPNSSFFHFIVKLPMYILGFFLPRTLWFLEKLP